MNDAPKAAPSHFTTRRGFIAGAGFSMVSLYLLWAAYGAAPLGFGGHGKSGEHEAHGAGGQDKAVEDAAHGAGGHGAGHAVDGRAKIEEFRGLVERFVEQHKLPDGSVQLRRGALAAALTDPAGHGGHAPSHADHPAGHEPKPAVIVEPQPVASAGAPVDVYLMAFQFGFSPAVIRLEAGVPYRFRMMAVDVAHGASIRVGPGSRVIRLRPGNLVEQELTFKRAGEYLVYCTVYCGLAHDRMQGKIIVSEAGAQK